MLPGSAVLMYTVVLCVVNILHILFLHSVFRPAIRSRHDIFIFYVVYSLIFITASMEHVPVLEIRCIPFPPFAHEFFSSMCP